MRMLSIQEVGKQVLSGTPKSFYIFIGEEYGIKEKYLDNLKKHYHDATEISKVSELLNVMSRKQIIPLKPKLYISRYDEEFIQSLDKNSTDKINKMSSKIIGTLVCIFEIPKHTSKCVKYLPDYTVSFDKINIEFVKKYLNADFPQIDKNLIDFSVRRHSDYKGAYNTCISLKNADSYVLEQYDNESISKVLGLNSASSEKQFRYGIASRNFAGCISIIDTYSGQLESLLYIFLSTMIDLERLLSNPKQKSDLIRYSKCWNVTDIYHMFMNAYAELEKSRTMSVYDVYNGLVYLIGLLQFSPIPEKR